MSLDHLPRRPGHSLPSDQPEVDPRDEVLVVSGTITEVNCNFDTGHRDLVISSVTRTLCLRSVPDEDGGTKDWPTKGDVVEVYGYLEALGGADGVAVECYKLPAHQVNLSMISLSGCPPIALDAMLTIVSTVMSLSDDLRQFLTQVLMTPGTIDRFMTAPASRQAHEAFPGGLAVHTAGILKRLQSLDEADFQSATTREVLLVAAILHDLGKITTVGGYANLQVSDEMRLIGLIDGPAWNALSQRQKSICEFLLYLIDPVRRREAFCAVPEVHHLIWADRVTASLDLSRRAFADADYWASTATIRLCESKSARSYRAVRSQRG